MTVGLLSIAKPNLNLTVAQGNFALSGGPVGFSQTSPSGTLSVGAASFALSGAGVNFNGGTGLQIVLVQDASVSGAPAGFMTDANTAASMLMAACPNTNITVYINVGYGTSTIFGSVPSTSAEGSDLGAPAVSYSTLRSQMVVNNKSTTMNTLLANTPAGTSISGQSILNVPRACCKALGIFGLSGGPASATDSTLDGACVIGTGITHTNLVGVFLHELTHAMGREAGGSVGPISLSRFTSVGNRDFNGISGTYFSIDGGTTKLAAYAASTTDPSDYLNGDVQDGNTGASWQSSASDPFDAFYAGLTTQSLTTVDIQLLQAMGFQ